MMKVKVEMKMVMRSMVAEDAVCAMNVGVWLMNKESMLSRYLLRPH